MLPFTARRAAHGKVEVVVNCFGERKTQIFNCTWDQFMDGYQKLDKYMIQDAMPFLTPAEREFMITGLTNEEFDEMFGEEEEEDNSSE